MSKCFDDIIVSNSIIKGQTMYFVADLHYNKMKTIDVQLNTLRQVRDNLLAEEGSGERNLFILGDLFHSRTEIDIGVMNKVLDFFEEEETKRCIIHIVTGNHDIYYNDRLDVSSLVILDDFHNVSIYNEVELIKVENKYILVVPWITENKKDEMLKRVEELEASCDFIVAHLETPNALVTKSYASKHGYKLKTKKPVISGHYHIKQQLENVYYVGSLIQENFNDFGIDKGYLSLPIDRDVKTVDDFEFHSLIHLSIIHVNMRIKMDDETGKKIEVAFMDGINRVENISGTEKAVIKALSEKIDSYKGVKINVEVIDNKASIKRVVEAIKPLTIRLNVSYPRKEELKDDENINLISDFGSKKGVNDMLIEAVEDDERAKEILSDMLLKVGKDGD